MKFHPDRIKKQFTELKIGPNKGQQAPIELAEMLQAKPRLEPEKIDLNHIDYRVKPESAPFITDKGIYTLMGKGGTDYRRPSLVTPDNEVQLRDIVDENTPLKQEYFQNHKLITFMPPYSSRSLDLTSVDWKKMKQQDFPVTVKALEEGKFYLKDDGAWYLDSMFNN